MRRRADAAMIRNLKGGSPWATSLELGTHLKLDSVDFNDAVCRLEVCKLNPGAPLEIVDISNMPYITEAQHKQLQVAYHQGHVQDARVTVVSPGYWFKQKAVPGHVTTTVMSQEP